jgi:hypothetical protein
MIPNERIEQIAREHKKKHKTFDVKSIVAWAEGKEHSWQKWTAKKAILKHDKTSHWGE